MARTSAPAPRRAGRSLVPPALLLARWRLGQTWRLLTVAGLGMLAAVMLVAAVPLFSLVATSAGLRATLADDPAGSGLTVNVRTVALSPALRTAVQGALFPIVDHNLGPYLTGTPTFTVQTPYLPLATVGRTAANPGDSLRLWGANAADVTPRVTISAGRLPTAGATPLEVALSQAEADALHAHIGDSIAFGDLGTAHVLPVRIVGIIALRDVGDPYWADEDFTPQALPGGNGTAYAALASADAIMAVAAQASAFSAGGGDDPAALTWHYTLDLTRLSSADLTHIAQQFDALGVAANNSVGAVTDVQSVGVLSGLDALTAFQTRIFALQIPVTLLLLQVLALVIFFVSLMADLIIERQTEAIAVLRSRGASRRQIFGALALQVGSLALGAAIVGPFLAILGVRLVAGRTLVGGDQGALNVLAGDPLALIWSIRWYILAAVLGACAAMLIAINRAMGLDVLALRRESARTTRRPLWQRLNLDVVAALIGITGYGAYVIGVGRLAPRLQSLLSPLALIAPLFLLLAAALLFLRIFPLALRAGAWLAGRGRRAEPMLALAQMARAPRQSMRTTLLLALTTAFTIFAFIFVASQGQHTRDEAAFTVGADLSGTLPAATAATNPTPGDQERQYAALPGVTSATVGYTTAISAQTNVAFLQVALDAVDADTYARTAVWNATNSRQSIGDLMATLRAHRADAAAQDAVPCIVDDAMWGSFDLSQDPHFTLSVPGYGAANLHLVALGHIAHIAGIYDVPGNQDSGGVLADFASYAAVYAQDTSTTVQQNTIWLRTTDDPATLTTLRGRLNDGTDPLHLTQMLDRRAIIATAARDPLVIDLLGILGICAVTAGILGVVGALVASWLAARSRLTNFAVLRALGSAPPQTARVLVWEQGIIIVTALALGLGLGVILASAVLPTLIFTNLLSRMGVALSTINVPPIVTVIPLGALAGVIGGVALLFVVLLAVMTRIVARPSISQTLRLNED